MYWRYLLIMATGFFTMTASAGRCDEYTGLDRLACEKSAHKIQEKSGRSKRADATQADTGGRRLRNAIDPERKPQVRAKKKVILPHNRHVGPRERSALSEIPKKSHKKASAGQSGVASAPVSEQIQSLHDAGLVRAGSQSVLASDTDSTDLPMPKSEMLASDVGLDSDPASVGDDALYRIY